MFMFFKNYSLGSSPEIFLRNKHTQKNQKIQLKKEIVSSKKKFNPHFQLQQNHQIPNP